MHETKYAAGKYSNCRATVSRERTIRYCCRWNHQAAKTENTNSTRRNRGVVDREAADAGDAAGKNADFAAMLRETPYLVNYFISFACEHDHLTPAFFQFQAIAQESDSYWYWPNVWTDHCENLWSAAEFPAFVESNGLVEYWREVGWPRMCWPVGDGFACGVKPAG